MSPGAAVVALADDERHQARGHALQELPLAALAVHLDVDERAVCGKVRHQVQPRDDGQFDASESTFSSSVSRQMLPIIAFCLTYCWSSKPFQVAVGIPTHRSPDARGPPSPR